MFQLYLKYFLKQLTSTTDPESSGTWTGSKSLFGCTLRTGKQKLKMFEKSLKKVSNFKLLTQWFPTTVPRNTSVPQAGPKCSAKFFEILKFIQNFKIFGPKCSVRVSFSSEVFCKNFSWSLVFLNSKKVGNHCVNNFY
jgi:biotin synthase-like enzyme